MELNNVNNLKNVAIIFGKKDDNYFNRYTFPILGRPVAWYPILAALNTPKIHTVYLTSDALDLLELGQNIPKVTIFKRENSQPTLTEEVRLALNQVKNHLGNIPSNVVIIFANSPCIKCEILSNALTYLEENPKVDSVVTTMKRGEFNPIRMFSLKNMNRLERQKFLERHSDEVYFMDHRIMIVRAKVILNSKSNNNYIESLLGTNIHPIIQQDGVWDIDYVWQVPMVERWLKQNGFSETGTPYDNPVNLGWNGRFKVKKKKVLNNYSKSLKRILITTVPFGEIDPTPLDILNENPNVEYVINPLRRKLKEDELVKLVKDFNIIVAGTEPITRRVMENSPNLKLIARVGIGLDNVDLNATKDLGIVVTYTPDAPAPAVAELTIAHMLNLLRKIPVVDRNMRSGIWKRLSGERLSNKVIGIIGTGRVGSRVLRHLQGFNPRLIFVNDLEPDYNLYEMYYAEHTEKETIYKECDIISFHVPLTPLTKNLITEREIELMKSGTYLINTARGGIINEHDLYSALQNKRIAGAAIDVFENEPYSGNLIELDNCMLSCHMGSMTKDCRALMELQAAEEVNRYVNGEPLLCVTPQQELYINTELRAEMVYACS